jgi:hypothetical protein
LVRIHRPQWTFDRGIAALPAAVDSACEGNLGTVRGYALTSYHKLVANVLARLGCRKPLSGFFFEFQREPNVIWVAQPRPAIPYSPRTEHCPQGTLGRIGEVVCMDIDFSRKNVASCAPGHQNFLACFSGTFEDYHLY